MSAPKFATEPPEVCALRGPGDMIVLSIHWGGNWGYEIPWEQRAFAHKFLDLGAVDVIHGHSSHHPKGSEVYNGRLVLYGCGDFLTDYEGISGYEAFRSNLVLMYFVTLDARTEELVNLKMTPLQMKRFRLQHADANDTAWLMDVLNHEGQCNTEVVYDVQNSFVLHWPR